MADEETVDVDEPRDQPQQEPDSGTDEPACPCGSREHAPLRIGEWISPSGPGIGGVYVCPEKSDRGLKGAL